jgi:hypothetical protein
MADQKPGANPQKGNNANAATKDAAPVKLTPEQVLAKKQSLFKELAPKRTRQVLKSLEILGNCSNRSGYDYTPENIEKIFTTIEKKVAETKAMFSKTSAAKVVEFTL